MTIPAVSAFPSIPFVGSNPQDLGDAKKLFIEEFCREKVKAVEKHGSSIHQTVKDYNGPQFIYEFIQNACDSIATQDKISIRFELHSDDTLVISHSGQHFNERDIETISNRESNDNAKQENAQKIGYKGVGFKSIFNHSNRVAIVSDGYSFRFDKCADEWKGKQKFCWELCPLFTPSEELISTYGLDPSQVHFVIKLDIQPEKTKGYLKEFFENKAPEIFYFLPGLKSLQFKVNEQEVTLEKTKSQIFNLPDDLEVEIFELTKNGEKAGKWLRYKKTILLPEAIKDKLKKDDRNPTRYKTMETTPISFILPFQNGGAGKERLYCYLPTEISIGLPLPINAHFFLNSNRKSLEGGDSFNEFLFSSIGTCLIQFYAYVAKEHRTSFFSILVNPKSLTFDTNPEEYKPHFQNAVEQAFDSIPFLPSVKGTLVSPKEAIIDQLRFLEEFGEEEQKKRILARCDSKFHARLEEMGVTYYSWEKIKSEFPNSPFFKQKQVVSRCLKLLRYFKRIYEVNTHLLADLKKLPFILSTSLSLLPPAEIRFAPEKLIEGLETVAIPLVHSELVEQLDETEKEWLKNTLGISIASPSDFVNAINKKKSVEWVQAALKALWPHYPANKEFCEAFRSLQLPDQSAAFHSPSFFYFRPELNPLFPLNEVAPSYKKLLPSKLYPEPLSEENKARLHDFFSFLGVKETIDNSNIYDIVQAVIKDQKEFEFVRLIYTKFFVSNQTVELDICVEEMKGRPLLLTTNKSKKNPSDCFLSSHYRPKMDLFSAPSIQSHLFFVSRTYVQGEEKRTSWKQFFLKLGVRETIRVEVFEQISADEFTKKLEKELTQSKIAKSEWQNHNYINYLWNKTDYTSSEICNGYCKCKKDSQLLLGCKPTIDFKSQHTLTPATWIEYFFALKGTRFFWEAIRDNWEQLSEKFREKASYSTLYSMRKTGIPTLHEFYTRHSVKDDQDTLHHPEECYAPDLRWLVKGVLPVPMEDFPLNAEQSEFFKFKKVLSLTDCITLLNHFAEHPEEPDLEKKIGEIYLHILKHQPEEILQINSLLSAEGTFCDPKSLVGNCIENLTFKTRAAHLLKRPDRITLEQHRQLCNFFEIPLLEPAALQVEVADAKEDHAFKERLIQRLPFAYAQDSQTQLQKSYADFKMSLSRVKNIQVFEVSKIIVSENQFEEAVFAWLKDGSCLYGKDNFNHPHTLKDAAQQLRSFLNLPCPTEELVQLLGTSDEQIEEYYRYKGEEALYEAAKTMATQLHDEEDPSSSSEEKVQPSLKRKRSSSPEADSSSSSEKFGKRKRSPSPEAPQKRAAVADDTGEKPRPIEKVEKFESPPKRGYSSSSSYSSDPKRFAAEENGKPQFKKVVHDRGIIQEDKEYGRQGEVAVFEYFKKKYGSNNNEGVATRATGLKKTVHWINWQQEKGTPYDFEITYENKKKYIEVKAHNPDTALENEQVGLSEREAAQLAVHGENYALWIVRFQSNGTHTLHKLKNPAQRLEQGKVEKKEIIVTRTKVILTIPEEELTKK